MQNDDKPAPRFFPQGNNDAAPPSATGEIRVFIPARLDDYGLKPTFFRVYCHICHRSLENQPRKVELIRPLSLHKRNKHFHSKKLHSRALRGVFWNENANLRKLTGRFDSTLAGRFVVTADTISRAGMETTVLGRRLRTSRVCAESIRRQFARL